MEYKRIKFMPLHTIKKVTELVPATSGLVKRASLEQNLPTGTREETLISALELTYMMKIAHSTVDIDDAERVCRAVDLYGLADEVRSHAETMVKSANYNNANAAKITEQVLQAENFIEHQLNSMNPDLEKVAEACEELWDVYSENIKNDHVKLYSGAGTLVKEAAILALQHRARRTGNVEFEKVAEVISATDTTSLSIEDNRSIISAIKQLEKAAHYRESDLYKDMFMTKAAAVQIKLGRKVVDATRLIAVADQAGNMLGKDIGKLLKDASSNKAAIEALPMGELQAIAGLV